MKESDLTSDENYLRSYYLHGRLSPVRRFFTELGFILPAIVLACVAEMTPTWEALWVAFIYMIACYFWRIGDRRWGDATRSLIEKYESRIAQLELIEVPDK